jgi:glutamate-1-semialdehyde 2,1-aminomutase
MTGSPPAANNTVPDRLRKVLRFIDDGRAWLDALTFRSFLGPGPYDRVGRLPGAPAPVYIMLCMRSEESQSRTNEALRARTTRSNELFSVAAHVLPGGVGSTARSVQVGWTPYPPFIERGEASWIWDVDGNGYVDYLLGLGPMLLGHRHPIVTEAVVTAVRELGTMFGLPYELERAAAEKVVAAVPGIDMVRFSNSGSEAAATATRLARAFTGRPLVVRFEGMYHGWIDTLYWSNHPDVERAGPADRPTPLAAGPGVPPALADSIVVLPWNDVESIESFMRERGDDVAAVITEPVMLNTGCILPEPGYLETLRALADQFGALLIFDEVITGFRFARGGAQEHFGVRPDLTVLAKGLGGGFPVAAIGGAERVMSMIAEGRYSQSGTYNSNTVAAAAVCAAMDVFEEPGIYQRQVGLGTRLMDGIRELATDRDVPVQVVGLGTVFQVWFSAEPIRNYRDAVRCSSEATFRRWWEEMFVRDVLFHPNHFENLFLSMVHTDDDVDRTLDAAAEAIDAIASEGPAA